MCGDKMAKITDVIKEIATPIVLSENCVIFDVEYKKEGSDYVLRVLIEKENIDEYISINDCENISRKLSDELDRVDPIKNPYMLEVSSPGIDRPLRCEADFEKYNGRDVDIGLYKAINKSKVLTGTLTGYKDDIITIDIDGEVVEINKKDTSYVKLSIDF